MIRTISAVYCLIFFLPAEAAEPEPIGVIKVLQGPVTIERSGQRTPATLNGHIRLLDIARTGAGGRTDILFSDGARVSLDPESELQIARFQYAPAQKQFEKAFRLLSGIAAYVSGKIAVFAPGSVRMETPVGVIGLHGTEFVAALASEAGTK